MLPQDPVILLSYVNTKLRDDYPTPDRAALEATLHAIGYDYDTQQNRFL